MAKPQTRDGYSGATTDACERILVTLIRGLGPLKESVYLIGGLTPRYIVSGDAPEHVGTLDVDIVLELQVLIDTNAYQTLEENLKRIGFERAENSHGAKQSWRWKRQFDERTTIILDLLADDPNIGGGKVQPIPSEGSVSALNIPGSSIVFDLYDTTTLKAELLDDNGSVEEAIRHANLVSFVCLKALAFDDRGERKDAYDLIYCLENVSEDIRTVSQKFKNALSGNHVDVITRALNILRKRFVTEEGTEGHLKDGPVAVAKFELGESLRDGDVETRILRQRDVSQIVTELLSGIQR